MRQKQSPGWTCLTISFVILSHQIINLECKSISNNSSNLSLLSSSLQLESYNNNNLVDISKSNSNSNNVTTARQNVTVAKGPPRIVNNDKNNDLNSISTITVLARDNVELKCPLTSEPPPLYDWFKGTERIDSSWERFDLSSSYERNVLHIRSVVHEDGGEYTCEAVNGFGKRSFTVSLEVTGEDPFKDNFLKSFAIRRNSSSFSNNSNNLHFGTVKPEILKEGLPKDRNISLAKGANVTLKCESKGNPKPNVVWFKDEIQLSNPRLEMSILKLSNVTDADSGLYTCAAENYFGRATYEIGIAIEGSWHRFNKAEIIEISPFNLTLFPGENGSIKCVAKVVNEFLPYFFWVKKTDTPSQAGKKLFYHNGSYFEVIGRTEITESIDDLFTTDLVLTNVTRADAGSYHCVVTGLMDGYTHSEAHVFVHNDPMQVLSVKLSKARAITIQWAVFACFLFLIVAVLLLTCIYRIYRHDKEFKQFTNKKSPSSTSSFFSIPFFRTRKTVKSKVVGIATTVCSPETSPGEITVSTCIPRPSEESHVREPLVGQDMLTTRVKYTQQPSSSTSSRSSSRLQRNQYQQRHFSSVRNGNGTYRNFCPVAFNSVTPSIQNYYEHVTYNDNNQEDEDDDDLNYTLQLSESDVSSLALNSGSSSGINCLEDSTSVSSYLLQPIPSSQLQPYCNVNCCSNCNPVYCKEDQYNSDQPSLSAVDHRNCTKHHRLCSCHHEKVERPPANCTRRHYHRHQHLHHPPFYGVANSGSSNINSMDEKVCFSRDYSQSSRDYKIHYQQPPSSPVSFRSSVSISEK